MQEIRGVSYFIIRVSTMREEYIIRMFQSGDEEALVNLLKIIFNPWPDRDLIVTDLDHYKWKYVDNPAVLNVTSVGISDGRIIGCNHGFTIKIKLGDKIYLGSQATDFGVHPDFRRKGLSKKISAIKTDFMNNNGITFVYALTQNPIVVESNLRYGRKLLPYKLVEMIKLRDVEKHIKMTESRKTPGKNLLFKILSLVQKLRSTIFDNPIDERIISIRKIDKFNAEIEEFIKKIQDEFSFILVRNSDYLNWRYCDPRGGNYDIYIAEEDSKPLGYLVLRLNRLKPEYPTGWIMDLLTIPNRPDIVSALISHAINYFDENDVNVIRYWILKGHPNVRIFQKNGFVDIGKDAPTAIFQIVDIRDEWTQFINSPVEKIHFQIGDTEWM